jgi:tetratricopeptide (TPR) repeat protein/tRNA A-37 threonylcarbamoyl transferase component Bud32
LKALLVDQRARWQQGEKVLVEAYLAQETGLAGQAEAMLDLIGNEIILREESGESPALSEYLGRFPQLSDALKLHFEVVHALQAETLVPPESLSPGGAFPPTRLQETPGPMIAGPPSTEASGGQRIAGYEILGELGRGAMGVVYRARQVGLNRVVALKMILAGNLAGKEELGRFRREAEAVARLQHPHIVQVFEVGEDASRPFLSLEFVEGGTLAQQIAGTPQPARPAAQLMATLARTMDWAHQQGIIHRDLKPANVLLGRKPNAARGGQETCLLLDVFEPKISDFGLAKRLDGDDQQTRSGAIMGTPSYMAPEQAAGRVREIGAAADIYALSAILYELLTGRPPFKGATVWDTVEQVRTREPAPPSQLQAKVPRDLETICLKGLRKDPRQRYASAGALADDLQRFLDGKPILARPAGRAERLLKWAQRSPYQAAALAAGLACSLALFVALVVQLRSAQKDAALFRQEAELERLARQEDQRRDSLRERFEKLYLSAEEKAQAAVPADVKTWAAVERDAQSALDLIANDAAFTAFPLREPVVRLLTQAQGHLADERVRAEHRERLARLRDYSADASFFSTLSSGLEWQDNWQRTHEAATRGLRLFAVTADNDGPPAIDRRFYTPEEIRFITDACYQLLVFDAEALAQRRPGQEEAAWHKELRLALRLLQRADRLQPDQRTHAVLVRRAEYLREQGQAEKAKQAQQDADKTAPSLAADFYLLGLQHYRREEFQAALNPLATALRLQPGHYGARYLRSVCLLRLGENREAKVGLTLCLEQRPGFLWAHLLRGYAEMNLGDFPAARADFDVVLKQPPDRAASYVALVNSGVLAMHQRDWGKAVADLRQAIDLMPHAVPAYINLALTYRQQVEVSPWQSCTLLLAPQGIHTLLALASRKRQARSEAVAILDEAIRRHPGESRLYHERGRLYLQQDVLRLARDDFARAVALAANRRLSSTVADDLIELGRLLVKEGKYAEAVQEYRAVLQIRPDQAQAHRLMAEALLAQRQYQEAGAALDRYLATIPVAAPGRVPEPEQARKLADAFKARGLIHGQQKNYRAAIASYTQGLSLAAIPFTIRASHSPLIP